MIEDELLPDGIHWSGVDSDGLWFQQDSRRLRLEQLSDGFRSVLALLFDVLRQLQLTYRHECPFSGVVVALIRIALNTRHRQDLEAEGLLHPEVAPLLRRHPEIVARFC